MQIEMKSATGGHSERAIEASGQAFRCVTIKVVRRSRYQKCTQRAHNPWSAHSRLVIQPPFRPFTDGVFISSPLTLIAT